MRSSNHDNNNIAASKFINTTTTEETGRMSSGKAASPAVAAPTAVDVVGAPDDSRFDMSEVTIEWNANQLVVEGNLIQVGSMWTHIFLRIFFKIGVN